MSVTVRLAIAVALVAQAVPAHAQSAEAETLFREGAVVTTQPAGDVRYLVNSRPSAAAVATDASGVAFVFNVAPSATTINATVSGMTLRSHVLEGLGGALTQTEIQP